MIHHANANQQKAGVTKLTSDQWRRQWHPTAVLLQSTGSRRVRHDWATSLSLFTFMHWRRKWQPTPVFLENPRDGVAQRRTQQKWLSSSSNGTSEQEVLPQIKKDISYDEGIKFLRWHSNLKCLCTCKERFNTHEAKTYRTKKKK